MDVEAENDGVAPRILAYMMDKYVDKRVRMTGLVGHLDGSGNGFRAMQCCDGINTFKVQTDMANDVLQGAGAADVVGVVMQQPGMNPPYYLKVEGATHIETGNGIRDPMPVHFFHYYF